MATKIIIAVHGIGEQLRGETIRTVAYQVCRFWGVPAAMPLGRFGAELIPTSQLASGTVKFKLVEGTWNTNLHAPPERPSGTMKFSNVDEVTWEANQENPAPGSFLVTKKVDPALPASAGNVVLGEVYWADVPRGPAADRYTLEESKKWAHVMVERVRNRDWFRQPAQTMPDKKQYEFARMVIEQMVEGIGVLGRLFFLAEKAGLPSFEIDELLVNYLGDVQVVTEFRNYRRKILDTFHSLMSRALTTALRNVPAGETPEIYIVAHSEGSVIAYLGILEALVGRPIGVNEETKEIAPWVTSLKGVMTIGSPIGKHHLLWDWLWENADRLDQQQFPKEPIKWRNYYDYGDPVGFNLADARGWLKEKKWFGVPPRTDVFEFGEVDDADQLKEGPLWAWSRLRRSFSALKANVLKRGGGQKGDIGFTRYSFPGKAHVDYWKDKQVFGHFLGNVVWPGKAAPGPETVEQDAPAYGERPTPPPRTKVTPWFLSRSIPYLMVFAALFAAAFCLLTGRNAARGISLSIVDMTMDAAATTLVLFAITAAVRIARLTKNLGWIVGTFLVSAACLVIAMKMISTGQKYRLEFAMLQWHRHLQDFLHEHWARYFPIAHAKELPKHFSVSLLSIFPAAVLTGIVRLAKPAGLAWSVALFVVLAILTTRIFLELPAAFGLPQNWYDDFLVQFACLLLGYTGITYIFNMLLPNLGVKPVVVLGMIGIFVFSLSASVPLSNFIGYTAAKAETAKVTGLSGSQLDTATIQIMLELAKDGGLPTTRAEIGSKIKLLLKNSRFDLPLRVDVLLRDLQVEPTTTLEAKPRFAAVSLQEQPKIVDERTLIGLPDQSPLDAAYDPLFRSDLKTPSSTPGRMESIDVPTEPTVPPDEPKLWPMCLACAAFFYLWWLAALLLDLTVVWHHFIKGEAVIRRLHGAKWLWGKTAILFAFAVVALCASLCLVIYLI